MQYTDREKKICIFNFLDDDRKKFEGYYKINIFDRASKINDGKKRRGRER